MKNTKEVSVEKIPGLTCKKHGALKEREIITVPGQDGEKSSFCIYCFRDFLASVIDEVEKE